MLHSTYFHPMQFPEPVCDDGLEQPQQWKQMRFVVTYADKRLRILSSAATPMSTASTQLRKSFSQRVRANAELSEVRVKLAERNTAAPFIRV